jgi:hypothetical protein
VAARPIRILVRLCASSTICLGLVFGTALAQTGALPDNNDVTRGRAVGSWDTFADTWVATDGLGRLLPTNDAVGPPRPNRTVGIFYYL